MAMGLSVDFDRMLEQLSRRLYSLEQRITNPDLVGAQTNEFNEIIIGPEGNQTVISTQAPGVPQNLAGGWGTFFDRVFIDANWDAPASGAQVDRYEIEVAKKIGASYEIAQVFTTGGTAVRIEPVERDNTYGLRATAISAIGIRGASTGWVDVAVGKDNTIPDPPTNVVLAAGLTTITMSWDRPSSPDMQNGEGLYEVQIASDAAFSVDLQTRRVSAEVVSFSGIMTGLVRFGRVSSIDSSGNQSTWVNSTPASVNLPMAGTIDIADNSILNTKLSDGAVTAPKVGFTVGGGNLLTNSSYEDATNGLAGWIVSTGAPVVDTVKPQHGAKSLKMGYQAQVYRDLTGLTPGKTYMVSAWASRAASTDTLRPQMMVNNAAGAGTVTATLAQGDVGPTRLVVAFTAQANGIARIHLRGDSHADSTKTGNVYWDAVQFEIGDVVTAYAPKPDEILPSTVISDYLAANAVINEKILNDAVSTLKIAPNAIDTNRLALNAVTSTRITDGAVTETKIGTAAVTAAKVGFGIGGGNLVSNSSFEIDTDANGLADLWTTYQGSPSYSLVTTPKAHGARSQRVQITEAAVSAAAYRGPQQQNIPVPPGATKITFSVSVHVAAISGCGVELHTQLVAAAGGLQGAPGLTISAATAGMTRYVWTRDVPAGTTAVHLLLGVRASGGDLSADYYLDAAQVEIGDIATAYAPKPDEILAGTITTTEISDNAITTPKIVTEAIIADRIALNAVEADKIKAGAVVTDKIAANAVIAEKIASGAVTANKLNVIMGGGNLLPDSSAEGPIVGYTSSSLGSGGSLVRSTDQKRSGSASFKITVGTTSYAGEPYLQRTTPYLVPVTPGQIYTLSGWVYRPVGMAWNKARCYIVFHTATGAVAGVAENGPQFDVPEGVWTRIHMTKAAPADAASVRVLWRMSGTVAFSDVAYFDDLQLEEGDYPTAYAPMTDEILPGTVLTTHLAAEAVTADKIKTNTISTRQMLVGNFDNLIQNPGFEFGQLPHIPEGTGTWAFIASGARSGAGNARLQLSTMTTATYLSMNGASSGSAALAGHVGATAGDRFYAECWVKSSAAVTNTVQIGLRYLNSAGAVIGSDLWSTPVTPTTTYQKIAIQSAVAGAPNGTVAVVVLIVVTFVSGATQYLYFDDFYMRRMVEGNIVVDGTIVTDKLAANAITAEKIASGAITTEKLTVGGFTGDNIIPNAGFEEVSSVNASHAALWTLGYTTGSTGTYSSQTAASALQGGTRGMGMHKSSNTAVASIASKAVPVAEGERYYVRVPNRASADSTTGKTIRVVFDTTENAAQGASGQTTVDLVTPNSAWWTTWSVAEGQVTVPAGARWMRVMVEYGATSVNGVAYVDEVSARRAVVSAVIQDGAVVADKIAANAVTAAKLTVGAVSDNFIRNSSFEDAALLNTWHLAEGGGIVDTDFVTQETTAFDGRKALQIKPGVNRAVGSYAFPTVPGRTYFVRVRLRHSDGTGTRYVRVNYRSLEPTDGKITSANRTGYTDLVANYSNASLNGVWEEFVYQWVAPVGATWGSLAFYNWGTSAGSLFVDAVEMRPVTSATQIQDGAIVTDKLAANAITAEKINAKAVTTDKLSVQSVGENMVLNGDIEGGTYANGTAIVPDGWRTTYTTDGRVGTGLGANGYGKALRIAVAQATATSRGFPVKAGEVYYWSAKYLFETTAASGVYLRLDIYAGADGGTQISSTPIGYENVGGTAGVWNVAEGVFTVPQDGYLSFRPHGNWTGLSANRFDDFILRKVVTSAVIQDGAILTDKLAANSVVAAKIAAGAITTEKLTVGGLTGDNLIPNPGFEDASGTNASRAAQWTYGWRANSALSSFTFTLETAAANVYGGTRALGIAKGTSSEAVAIASKAVPVTEGERYYVRIPHRASTATPTGRYIQVVFDTTEDAAFGAVGQTVIDLVGANSPFPTTWTITEGQVVVPAGAKWMRVALYNWGSTVNTTVYYDEISTRRAVVSAVIQDGAITTPKIVAGAITADSAILADAVVTTAKIGDLQVTTGKIHSLEVGKILSGSITSAEITLAGSGAFKAGQPGVAGQTGLLMNAQGLRLYSGTTPTVTLDAITGQGTFTGTVNASGGTFTGNVVVGSGTGNTLSSGTWPTSGWELKGDGTATLSNAIIQGTGSKISVGTSTSKIVIDPSIFAFPEFQVPVIFFGDYSQGVNVKPPRIEGHNGSLTKKVVVNSGNSHSTQENNATIEIVSAASDGSLAGRIDFNTIGSDNTYGNGIVNVAGDLYIRKKIFMSEFGGSETLDLQMGSNVIDGGTMSGLYVRSASGTNLHLDARGAGIAYVGAEIGHVALATNGGERLRVTTDWTRLYNNLYKEGRGGYVHGWGSPLGRSRLWINAIEVTTTQSAGEIDAVWGANGSGFDGYAIGGGGWQGPQSHWNFINRNAPWATAGGLNLYQHYYSGGQQTAHLFAFAIGGTDATG